MFDIHKMKMGLFIKLSLLTLILSIKCDIQKKDGLVLDRNLLTVWYPSFIYESELNFYEKGITAVSKETFRGLAEVEYISLGKNEITEFDASLFVDLT